MEVAVKSGKGDELKRRVDAAGTAEEKAAVYQVVAQEMVQSSVPMKKGKKVLPFGPLLTTSDPLSTSSNFFPLLQPPTLRSVSTFLFIHFISLYFVPF